MKKRLPETTISEFINLKLSELKIPDNFDSVAVDIYDSDYGRICHLTFLMKKPFNQKEYEILEPVIKFIKKELNIYFSSVFTAGIQSSISTKSVYDEHKNWYDSKK